MHRDVEESNYIHGFVLNLSTLIVTAKNLKGQLKWSLLQRRTEMVIIKLIIAKMTIQVVVHNASK